MATREAIAIREEAAMERIARAAEMLSTQYGRRIDTIDMTSTRIDPMERNAVLAEEVADLLESLVLVEEAEVEAETEAEKPAEASERADNHKSSSSTVSRPKAKPPIKRSTTIGKR